jgi:hypothetical protein
VREQFVSDLVGHSARRVVKGGTQDLVDASALGAHEMGMRLGYVAVVAVRSVPELELEDLTQVLQELDGVYTVALPTMGN